MTNPVTEDIKDVLVDEGIGGFAASSGWSITIGKMTNSPDTMITLYDTGGFDQTALFGSDPLERPVLDIQVRANSYSTAYEKARAIDEILNLMDISANAILLALNYVGIFRSTDIFFIGYDENNRSIFGMHYRIMRYKS